MGFSGSLIIIKYTCMILIYVAILSLADGWMVIVLALHIPCRTSLLSSGQY